MMRVGLLWRGDPQAPPPVPEATRLRGVFEALSQRDVEAIPIVYADEVVDSIRERLLGFDGVLVWVDPITDGHDRSQLDPMLADVAARGVWVSAHPDTILKIGTKEVLFRTRGMSWGTDTRLYATLEQFRDALPKVLAEGRPRVLKQYRGNGGNGVWKIEAADAATSAGCPGCEYATRGVAASKRRPRWGNSSSVARRTSTAKAAWSISRFNRGSSTAWCVATLFTIESLASANS